MQAASVPGKVRAIILWKTVMKKNPYYLQPCVPVSFHRPMQVFASRVLEPADAMKCAHLAELGWQYSRKAGHDGRTLFVSEERLAACELYASGLAHVSAGEIETFANDILNSQETGDYKLNGYFYEKDKADGYRSIVWNAEPAMALLRVCELNIPGKADLTKRSAKADSTLYRKLYFERCSRQPVFRYSIRGVRKTCTFR